MHYRSVNLGASASLATTFTADSSTQGNMFDITAINAIEVVGLSTNLPAGDHDMEVYFRPGTHQGSEDEPLAWKPLTTVTVTSIVAGAATSIPLDRSLQIPSGRTYGLYITTTGATEMDATACTTLGAVAAPDANLKIMEGAGVDYSFEATASPQIFSGTVDYVLCQVEHLVCLLPWQFCPCPVAL